MLAFDVDGLPVPWSVRVVKRGQHGALKLDGRSRNYQQRIAQEAHRAAQTAGMTEPMDGPLCVRVVAVLARVKRLKTPGRHPAPVTPDGDRVLRNVLDGLHQYTPAGERKAHAGVIWDDSRVVLAQVLTVYADEHEGPCTEVRVEQWRADSWPNK